MGLQFVILATGNYTFFNFLSITFLLLVLDDAFYLTIFPARLAERMKRKLRPAQYSANPAWNVLLWIKTIIMFYILVLLFQATIPPFFNRRIKATLKARYLLSKLDIKHESLPAFLNDAHEQAKPYMIANSYGLFAGMTKQRDEIEIQGSNDTTTWETYTFKFKPGDVYRAPPFVAPHQPRVDWQMWFAALSEAKQQQWFLRFVKKLLEGSKPVLGLLETNPFPDSPPKYIRALRYRYKFTNFTSSVTAEGSAWWTRKKVGTYLDPITVHQLKDNEQV